VGEITRVVSRDQVARTLTALDVPEEGDVFRHWTSGLGRALAVVSSFKYSSTAGDILTAAWEDQVIAEVCL